MTLPLEFNKDTILLGLFLNDFTYFQKKIGFSFKDCPKVNCIKLVHAVISSFLSLLRKLLNLCFKFSEELFLIRFLKIRCCRRVRRISVVYQMGSEDNHKSFLSIYLLIPMSIISLKRSQLALTLLARNLT